MTWSARSFLMYIIWITSCSYCVYHNMNKQKSISENDAKSAAGIIAAAEILSFTHDAFSCNVDRAFRHVVDPAQALTAAVGDAGGRIVSQHAGDAGAFR